MKTTTKVKALKQGVGYFGEATHAIRVGWRDYIKSWEKFLWGDSEWFSYLINKYFT